MSDELKDAIRAFVSACARFLIAADEDRMRRKLELHTAWWALTGAWERGAP